MAEFIKIKIKRPKIALHLKTGPIAVASIRITWVVGEAQKAHLQFLAALTHR